MTEFLKWLSASHYGDLASVAGIFISVVGFIATLINVVRARTASESAKLAAQRVHGTISLFETVVDFTLAISTLEEIKRLLRSNEWSILPERYSATRKFLINLRHTAPDLSDSQLIVIQDALTNLREMEKSTVKALQGKTLPNTLRFHEALTLNIDGLIATLAEIKSTRAAT